MLINSYFFFNKVSIYYHFKTMDREHAGYRKSFRTYVALKRFYFWMYTVVVIPQLSLSRIHFVTFLTFDHWALMDQFYMHVHISFISKLFVAMLTLMLRSTQMKAFMLPHGIFPFINLGAIFTCKSPRVMGCHMSFIPTIIFEG